MQMFTYMKSWNIIINLVAMVTYKIVYFFESYSDYI